MITEELLNECKKMRRPAQRTVYEYLSPKLYSVCKRYLKQRAEIEDVLAETFYIVFTKLGQLNEAYAFEAWSRKIAVNQCLAYLKKHAQLNMAIDELPYEPVQIDVDRLAEKDLLNMLTALPEGCRTVFNLFAIEGYSHKEIGKMLGISEGTSKSQLNFSRVKLKAMVDEFYYSKQNSHG